MGNADFENPVKDLEFETIVPLRTFDDPENPKVPLTYDYPPLSSLSNTQETAQACINNEMQEWLTKQGYALLEESSAEYQQLFRELNTNANTKLATTTNRAVGVQNIQTGTPIIVERDDESDPRKKLNVIFGVVKVTKKERRDNGRYYVLAHPVDKDGLGQLTLSQNHRTDESKSFDPPLWYIETKHPFGYHGEFAHIVSYPLQEGNPIDPEASHVPENRILKAFKALRLFRGRN